MDKARGGSKTPMLTVWIANAHENVFSLIFMAHSHSANTCVNGICQNLLILPKLPIEDEHPRPALLSRL